MTSIAILDHRHFEPDVRARLADIEGFVRSTRDVARDRSRTPEQRQDSLRDLENRMVGGGEAVLCLAQAASKEIITERFRSWSELISWAGYAAAPLGRQVLRLHDQDMAAAPHMESLYSAYCILSHVANCGDDFRSHGRVYIPADWLRRAGADSDCLAASSLTPELRAVLDQVLDGVDRLLAAGRPAAGLIAHRRLKLAVLTAQFFAMAWSRGLRRRDPLASPVAPSAMDRRWAVMRARWSLVFARSARRVPARAKI